MGKLAGHVNDTALEQRPLLEATDVRRMFQCRGYLVVCGEFHRTAGVYIGLLMPCHLSGRGDVIMSVMDHHNPE